MNKYLFFAAFVIVFASACNTTITPDPVLLEKISQLQKNNDYFNLKKLYDSKEKELGIDYSLYYGAIVDSYFNRPSESNSKIEKLFDRKNSMINDSLMSHLLVVREANHGRLYEYKEAAETCRLLIDNYGAYLSEVEHHELVNSYSFWNALVNVPKQKLQISGNPEFGFEIDNRGFWNVNVELSDTVCPFLFDTGTGTSMIKRSVAINQGYRIIEIECPIKAFTGRDVETNLAIAEKIKIGNVTFDNVIFLVIDDCYLEIPNKNIPVDGIIGFSAISALKDFTVREGMIIIHEKPLLSVEANMVINNVAPIIQVGYKTDTLLLKFDTGSTRTNFHCLFFQKYKNDIVANLTKRKIHASSLGGTIEVEVYKTGEVELSVSQSKTRIENANIFSKELKPSNSQYHGNMGLDCINQYKEINISYTNSTMSFR